MQNTRSVFAMATKNMKEKTTGLGHTSERKKRTIGAQKKKPPCLRRHTKNKKKRASSHGDRGTLGQHAAVKQGTWPTATLIIHSLAVIAPRSPRIALLGRRALASPRTRYPFSPFITSPINASDRQLAILPRRPMTLSSSLARPSRQRSAIHTNTPIQPPTTPNPHAGPLKRSSIFSTSSASP